MTLRMGGTSTGSTAQPWLIAMAVGFLVMAGTTTFAAAEPILVGLAIFSEVAVTGVNRVTDAKSGFEDGRAVSEDPLHDVFGEPVSAHASATTFFTSNGIDGLNLVASGRSQNDLAYSRAFVQVQYQVVQDVVPPMEVDFVPLRVSGTLYASASASSTAQDFARNPVLTEFAYAGIDFGGGAGQFVIAACERAGEGFEILCDPYQLLDFVATAYVRPGVTEAMSLLVEAEAVGSGTFLSLGSADPIVTIDPSFAFRNDYHLVFSPNLFVATVPEPPTLAMIFAGLVGLAAFKRRPAISARKWA